MPTGAQKRDEGLVPGSVDSHTQGLVTREVKQDLGILDVHVDTAVGVTHPGVDHES